jgi:hypothetical protein
MPRRDRIFGSFPVSYTPLASCFFELSLEHFAAVTDRRYPVYRITLIEAYSRLIIGPLLGATQFSAAINAWPRAFWMSAVADWS